MRLENLTQGSVIFGKQSIFPNSKSNIFCFAQNYSSVLILEHSSLQSIGYRYSVLKSEIERVKKANLYFDKEVYKKICTVPVLDYYKAFKPTAREKLKTRWLLIYKFKNCVLSWIIRKRKSAEKRIPNLKTMIEKIRSALQAENQGHTEISRMIARGEIPSYSVQSIKFLKQSELSNPVLNQFASIAVDTNNIISHLNGKIGDMREMLLSGLELIKESRRCAMGTGQDRLD